MIYVSSVNVSPSTVTLKKGQWYFGASATVRPENATCQCVEWSSSDPTVASVHSVYGNICANRAGTALIYATATDGSGAEDYLVVNVDDSIPVTSIELSTKNITIIENSSKTIVATVCPLNATKKDLVWVSNDQAVATVTDGVVYAKSPGTTSVHAFSTDGNAVGATCNVTVLENFLVDTITVSPSNPSMAVGEERDLYAGITPFNATNKTVRWSSSNSSVVEVDEYTGCIYAKAAGSATVYARAQDGSGKVGYCEVTVTPAIPVAGVTVCPKSTTMKIGESTYIYADVFPYNATNKAVTWRSDKTHIATVDAYGWVTAESPGTTTITAVTEDGGYRDSVTVNVVIDFVTIKPDGEVFNKVVFESTGKEWYCIGYDMIYDEFYMYDQSLIARSSKNIYLDEVGNTKDLKTFSNDEIKLLYAIDPHGVAHYIQKYAETAFSDLNSIVNYKDNIFYLLFKKQPRYFTETYDEEWVLTEKTNDWDNVVSESESYFGVHPTSNGLRIAIKALDVLNAVLCAIAPSKYDILVDAVISIGQFSLLIYYSEYEAAVDELISLAEDIAGNFLPESGEEAFDNFLDAVFNTISIYTSITELIDSFVSQPMYCRDIVDYIVNKTVYNVTLELANGVQCELTELHSCLAE